MTKGAIWLLWAIGVALALAVFTSQRTARRLECGRPAPPFSTESVAGSAISVPDPLSGFIHLQFLRFVGCPVCNLLLQSYISRAGELRDGGIHEILVFHSDKRFIEEYHDQLPFDVIADPHKKLYRQYGVEMSPWAILSPLAWPNLIKGYRLRPAGKLDSSPFGLPAEFLISPEGIIIASHYGSHSSDQWSVDDILQIAVSFRQTNLAEQTH
jgi:peroxiredoxin